MDQIRKTPLKILLDEETAVVSEQVTITPTLLEYDVDL
jgi:hypothetical protein